ncbi:MAG: GntR family transcriptional regulator [Actinomycetota bacterium]
MRRIIYREIAESLRKSIESGHYATGELLPSESALGTTFDASRVTVRKALELLRDEGLLVSRQGLGWSVATEPVTQSLDSLISIEAQMEPGHDVRREVTDFGFVPAPSEVVDVLGTNVLEVGRLNWVDDEPFSRIFVWCREDLAADLSRSQVEHASFLDLLGDRLRRAVQRIGAAEMPAHVAELLRRPEGSSALVVRRTAFGDDGEALFMSEHWFPGDATEFVGELSPREQPESRLRLVSEG